MQSVRKRGAQLCLLGVMFLLSSMSLGCRPRSLVGNALMPPQGLRSRVFSFFTCFISIP